MKAKYVKPSIEIMEMETEQLMAASLTTSDKPADSGVDNLSKPDNEFNSVWGSDDDEE